MAKFGDDYLNPKFDIYKQNNSGTNNVQKQDTSFEQSIFQTINNTSTFFDFDENYQFLENFQNNFEEYPNFRRKKHDIPNGHSHYEYKGAKFDIYRNEDEYKSQFIRPYGFDDKEFFEHFEDLERIVLFSKDNSTKTQTIKGINGEIDENVIQGITGDCWLISSVYSLVQTEEGRELIKDSITVNDDNTVTVSFKGLGVSYTLSADEIYKHDTDTNTSDDYSNGDNDMLVLELATEKLWEDINSGKIKLDSTNQNILYSGSGQGITEGGLPSQMIYYLTGIESQEYYNNDLSDLSKNKVYDILQNALDSGNTVLNIGLYYNTHTTRLTDGSKYSIDLGDGGHALAVTNITSDTVTFVNPWDGNTEYEVSWEEFANLGIGYISSSNLNNINTKEETTNMTDETDTNYKPKKKDFIPSNYNKENYFKPNPKKFDNKQYPVDNWSSNDFYKKIEEFINKILKFIKFRFGF